MGNLEINLYVENIINQNVIKIEICDKEWNSPRNRSALADGRAIILYSVSEWVFVEVIADWRVKMCLWLRYS